MKNASVGVDLGGTKTLCVLVDDKWEVVDRVKFKTSPASGRARFTHNLISALEHLCGVAREKKLKIRSAGAACAGRIDPEEQVIVESLNLKALEGFPMGKHLSRVLRVPILVGNDVQMGIYGEHQLGAAKGAQNALGIFFGTGVGGAVILNGELYRGSSGEGGQVGGILAQPVGGPRAAMSHGIVDRIASKASIAGEALVMAVKQWAPYLHHKVGTDMAKITWGLLARAIQRGDDQIEEMLRARLHVVGIALSSVVNFINPDVVVLGGGLVDTMGDLVLHEFEAGLREYLTPSVDKAVSVRLSKLGGYAPALGAAHASWKALKQRA